MKLRHDLEGMRFGLLIAIDRAPNQGRTTRWRCKCECGRDHVVRTDHLVSGRIVSCGCIGYRKDPERHRIAREKVPAERRAEIARSGRRAQIGAGAGIKDGKEEGRK